MLFGEEVIKKSTALEKLAEVVGSTPTKSTFINLVKYGIKINTNFTIVGQSVFRGGD
jgi:hypothetical protein